MCADDTPQRDTDPDSSTFEIVLEVLQQIKEDLGSIKEELGEVKRRQDKMEQELRSINVQLRVVSTDMQTLHSAQKSFVGRLHYVEEACIDKPLRSTPPPQATPIPAPLPGNDSGGVDGRRKG